jgi:hypothetical protein
VKHAQAQVGDEDEDERVALYTKTRPVAALMVGMERIIVTRSAMGYVHVYLGLPRTWHSELGF